MLYCQNAFALVLASYTLSSLNYRLNQKAHGKLYGHEVNAID
jgi:hypothetical protein